MNEATSRVRQTWDHQAKIWFAQREQILKDSRPVHEWLVRNAAPQAGQRLLEIAAGPGDTGFLAAKGLGNGRLVSTDLAPAMVEAARARAAELGITNADFRTLDAQAMELESESFDAAICRWGYMLMPDPAAAFRETRRVLKPGGRLAFAVFTAPAENPWVSIPVAVLREAGLFPQPSSEWQPSILALADRARVEALVTDAEFASLAIEDVGFAWTFPNTGEYWTFLEQTSAMGPVLRALPDDTRASIRASIDSGIAQFVGSDGSVTLPAKSHCALAVR